MASSTAAATEAGAPENGPGAPAGAEFLALLAELLPGGQGAAPPTAPLPEQAAEPQQQASQNQEGRQQKDQDSAAAVFYFLPVPLPEPVPVVPQELETAALAGAASAAADTAAPGLQPVTGSGSQPATSATTAVSLPGLEALVPVAEATPLETSSNSAPVEPQGAPAPANRPLSTPELAFAVRLTQTGGETGRLTEPAAKQAPAPPSESVSTSAPPSGEAAWVPPVSSTAEVAAVSTRAEKHREPEREIPGPSIDKPNPGPWDSLVGARPAAERSPGPAPHNAAKLERAAETTAAPPAEPARPQAPPSTSVHELSLSVPRTAEGRRADAVEVKLVERGGQVHVAVRSRDEQLNTTLRTELGELVTRLENSGYRAEAWRPSEPSAAPGTPAGAGEATVQSPRGASNREPSPDTGQRQQGWTGQESRQDRRQQESRPEWIDALDRSFDRQKHSTRSILYGVHG